MLNRVAMSLLLQWIIATSLGLMLVYVIASYSRAGALLSSGIVIGVPQAMALRSHIQRPARWIAMTWSGVFLAGIAGVLFGAGLTVILVDLGGFFIERYAAVSDTSLPVPVWWLAPTLVGFFGGAALGIWQFPILARPDQPLRCELSWWSSWSLLSALGVASLAISHAPALQSRGRVVIVPLLMSGSVTYAILTGTLLIARSTRYTDVRLREHHIPVETAASRRE